jgi:hypothetical protein
LLRRSPMERGGACFPFIPTALFRVPTGRLKVSPNPTMSWNSKTSWKATMGWSSRRHSPETRSYISFQEPREGQPGAPARAACTPLRAAATAVRDGVAGDGVADEAAQSPDGVAGDGVADEAAQRPAGDGVSGLAAGILRCRDWSEGTNLGRGLFEPVFGRDPPLRGLGRRDGLGHGLSSKKKESGRAEN